MPSFENTFHSRTAKHGGRFVPPSGSSLEKSLEYCKWRSNANLEVMRKTYPKVPDIYFDVFDSYDVNAFAFKDSGRYYVGYSRGLIATIGILFDRILGDRRLLQNHGFAQGELDELPSVEFGPNFFNSVANVPLFERPRDSLRSAIATRMGDIAFDFVFAHEVSHVANGHLDYSEAEYQMSEVLATANSSASCSVDYCWFRQAIEMDADRTATFMTLSSEIGKVLGRSAVPQGPIGPIYSSMSEILEMWCVSAQCFARLFGDDFLEDEGAPISPYPSWRLRSIGIQRMAHMVVNALLSPEGNGWDERDAEHNVLQKSFEDIEEIFCVITGKSRQLDGYLNAVSERGWKRQGELDKVWHDLEQKLEAFTYTKLIKV